MLEIKDGKLEQGTHRGYCSKKIVVVPTDLLATYTVIKLNITEECM